jgi:hypothetical protein
LNAIPAAAVALIAWIMILSKGQHDSLNPESAVLPAVPPGYLIHLGASLSVNPPFSKRRKYLCKLCKKTE